MLSVKTFPFVKLQLFLNHQHVLSIFSSSKMKCPTVCALSLFTKISCGGCNATYYGKTYRHLRVRVAKHSGVSPLTAKKSTPKKSTVVKDHMFSCHHIVSIDDFKILASSDSEFHVKSKESLLKSRNEAILNKNETPLPLYQFD